MDISALVRAVQARQDEDGFAACLSDEDWQRLSTVLQRRELQCGELLMQRGGSGCQAFLLEQGELQVFIAGGPARTHRMATLRPGDLVGEPALFGVTRRMAHVEALTPCVAWALEAKPLLSLAETAPVLPLEVLRAAGAVMARRMHAHQERGIPVA